MSNAGHFQPGPDARRNTDGGRAPTAASLSAQTRAVLGKDYRARLQQLCVLADAGDPGAVVACAVLLGAAMNQRG